MEVLTNRLWLREFVDTDWETILEYQREPRFQQFYPMAECSAESVRSCVKIFIDWQTAEPRTRYQLAITLRSNHQLIGSVGIRLKGETTSEAEIGYEIHPAEWGKGYASEAAQAMLAFGFSELNLHRVHAGCICENVASARVLQKAGLRHEGHLRQVEWMKGRWWDTELYAILEDEWRAHPNGHWINDPGHHERTFRQSPIHTYQGE